MGIAKGRRSRAGRQLRCQTILWCAAVAVSASACAADSDAEPALVEVLPIIEADLAWEVGGARGAGGVEFQSTTLFGAIGPAGTVAIGDSRAAAVLLFDSDGALIGSVGRRGSGPGEFNGIAAVGFAADSSVWASDPALTRITVFPSGETEARVLETPRAHVPNSEWTVRGHRLLADGAILGEPIMIPSAELDGQPPIPLAIWTPGNRTVEVVQWISQPGPTWRRIPLGGHPMAHMTGPQPIAGGPIIGVEATGQWIYVVDRPPATETKGAIVITRYAPHGTEMDRVAIEYLAQPMDTAVRERVMRNAQAIVDQVPAASGGVRMEDILNTTWMPSRLPPVQAAFADATGYWLQREVNRSGQWERYDLSGVGVARLNLPEQLSVLAATECTVLGVVWDDLNVAAVRMYRVSELCAH